MKALVTGASSGIGREIAIELDRLGYDIIAVARREDRLLELKAMLKNNAEIMPADLSDKADVFRIFNSFPDIDILVNNAGFGVFGEFFETDLKAELSMLNVNINALHTLCKLYLPGFKEKNSGRILNVASSAAFFPGPMFSSYYASKAYVYRLSRAINCELKKTKSKVRISVLCPGPVETEFGDVAGVSFGIGALPARRVAALAVRKTLKGRAVIVPGLFIKLTRLLSKISPDCINEKVVCMIQKKKSNGVCKK